MNVDPRDRSTVNHERAFKFRTRVRIRFSGFSEIRIFEFPRIVIFGFRFDLSLATVFRLTIFQNWRKIAAYVSIFLVKNVEDYFFINFF